MEELTLLGEVGAFIEKHGFSTILLAWMIYKDYKFNANILAVLDRINGVLARLETWHAKEDNNQ